MHETAIACEIMRQACSACRNAGAAHISRIEIEVGGSSGIDSSLLRETLRLACRQLSPKHRIEIDLIEIPVQARCLTCNAVFTPSALFMPCPACAGYRYEITQGEELRLRAVWIEQPDYSE